MKSMSQYKKSCMYCKNEIQMSDRSGNWLPYDLDGGTVHDCRNQKQTTTSSNNSKNGQVTLVSKKALTVEERLKRLEQIILDPRK